MSRLIRAMSLCTLAVAVGACEPAADPPPPPTTSPEATAEGPDAVPPTPDPADDHAAHAAPDGEGELLLVIMQRLGSEMARLTHALMTEDRETLADAAEGIAAHAPISAAELERIQTALGAEMDTFEELDERVHVSSVALRDVARSGDLQDVVRQLGEVQSGCVACHTEFRERLLTNR